MLMLLMTFHHLLLGFQAFGAFGIAAGSRTLVLGAHLAHAVLATFAITGFTALPAFAALTAFAFFTAGHFHA